MGAQEEIHFSRMEQGDEEKTGLCQELKEKEEATVTNKEAKEKDQQHKNKDKNEVDNKRRRRQAFYSLR